MFNRHGVPHTRLEFLRSLTLFEGIPDKVLSRVDQLVTELPVSAGAVLTRQGNRSVEAFIIGEGTAEVRIDDEVVGSATVGELVGELGLIEHKERSATVVATTPMRLLVLNPREFNSLMHEESLVDRIRENFDRHKGGAPS